MRILCVSDVIDKYLYNSEASISIKPDLIVSCGDLPKSYLEFLVTKYNVPLLFVQGNHDDYYLESRNESFLSNPLLPRSRLDFSLEYGHSRLFSGINLDRKIITFNGVSFLGFEGCNRYNNGLHQYSQKEMEKRVKSSYYKILVREVLFGTKIDVVVTHAPPYGIHDKDDVVHTGFKVFLDVMDRFKPRYFLHGHTHIYDIRESRVSRYKETVVINCYGYYILDI